MIEKNLKYSAFINFDPISFELISVHHKKINKLYVSNKIKNEHFYLLNEHAKKYDLAITPITEENYKSKIKLEEKNWITNWCKDCHYAIATKQLQNSEICWHYGLENLYEIKNGINYFHPFIKLRLNVFLKKYQKDNLKFDLNDFFKDKPVFTKTMSEKPALEIYKYNKEIFKANKESKKAYKACVKYYKKWVKQSFNITYFLQIVPINLQMSLIKYFLEKMTNSNVSLKDILNYHEWLKNNNEYYVFQKYFFRKYNDLILYQEK